MDDTEKAAVFLLSLDKPLAAEVMSQLPRAQVEKLTLRIAQMKNVSKDRQQAVIDEFFGVIGQQSSTGRGGMDLANELLEQSLGSEGATAILDNVRSTLNAVPFSFLQKANSENVLTFIVEEHPQTIALIISHLPAPLAAEVLGGLTPDKQLEVVRRIATMEQTNPEVVRDVESSLKSRMTLLLSQSGEKAGGVDAVAQILNVTDRMTNKTILESLEDDNAELVDEIRRRMFVFEDLLKLDERAIQKVLREVDNSQWATALKGGSEEIKDKIFSNLSQRAAETLREELDYLGPVKVSDVEGMQQQIVDTVRRLEEAGEIEVSSGSEADEYIT